jgi:hypothetical protein
MGLAVSTAGHLRLVKEAFFAAAAILCVPLLPFRQNLVLQER